MLTGKHRRAFTLLELGVVAAIICLLATLTFSVVGAARARSRESVCVSGLRQISHALLQYVNDNDNTSPPAVAADSSGRRVSSPFYWSKLLAPYLRSDLPHCPDAEYPGLLSQLRQRSFTSGYAYNENLNRLADTLGINTPSGVNEAALPGPSRVVLLADARTAIAALRRPDSTPNNVSGIYHWRVLPLIYSQTPGAIRHRGGANYAFADGHVRWYRPEEIRDRAAPNDPMPFFAF